MFRYIRVNQKGLILVLLPLLFELLFVAFLSQRLTATANEFDNLRHSQRALYKIYSIAETVFRSGLSLVSFQTVSLEVRSQALQKVATMLSRQNLSLDVAIDGLPELEELLEEGESSRRMILRLARRMHEYSVNSPSGLMNNRDRDNMIMAVFTMRSLYDRLTIFVNRLDSNEPTEVNRMVSQLILFLMAGFTVSCASSFLVAYVFTFDIVRRIKVIADNAYLVAAGKDLPEPQKGTDEIAELDRALHKSSVQLKAFQKKQLAILNNTADVVCSLDRQLRFVAVGESAERIWQYSSDDLLGRSMLTILASDTATSASKDFEALAKSGNDADITTVVKCKDGTLKDSLWTINWSHDAKEFVCVVHDITELKKIEKLKQAFFSMVSHDLRAPLTSININLANMTSGFYGQLPAGAEKTVKNAVSSTERLTALVNDLLDLDKLESGKFTLDLEYISIRDVLESSIQSLESMAANAGVEIVGPIGDAAVLADEKRLVQAVTNLISNAVKFSPQGQKVRVRISRLGDLVEVAVSDNGPGIPFEQQNMLFDKYTQGSAASNIKVKGTGLGLAIVKSIIKAHEGEVGVTSEPGHGATFWIRLKEFTDDGMPQ